MKILSFIFLFVFTVFQPSVENVPLKYTFRVGDRYDYIQVSKQKVKQTVPGMGEVTLDADISGVMELKILQADVNTAKVEAKYSKLKMTTRSSMLNMDMDSDGSQDDASNKVAKAMMNKTFTFVMNANGKVDKVEGAENLYSDFNTLGMDEASVTQMKRMLQQTLNDKSLESILTNGFLTYPDKKVKEGDTWQSKTLQTTSVSLMLDNTWTLGKKDGSTVSVSADGVLSPADKDKVIELPNGIKSKTDLSGKQILSGTVDVKTGWPTVVNVSANLKGNTTLLAGGMIPQDMVLPMDMVIETTYTIKRK